MSRYVLDKGASRFTVQAFATGMLASMGHNPTIAIRDFTGEADLDPGDMEKASLRLQIRSSSLEVTDDIKSKDRKEIERMMNEQVLETAKYPQITFEGSAASHSPLSEGRSRVNLDGTLSLHGTTSKVPLTVQVAFYGDTFRASGEFSIRQSDYAIPLVSVAGGALKLKDELKFTFDMVARKQE